MSISPSKTDEISLADLRAAVATLKAAPQHAPTVICHPYDSFACVCLAGRWVAFKMLLQNWQNRSDEEIMDGLYWIVRGFPW